MGAGVADREALAGTPAEERLARRRAVEDGVARDHAALRRERRVRRGPDHEPSAREPLPGVVVARAREVDRKPGRRECRDALARTAVQAEHDGSLGQPAGPRPPRDLTGQAGAGAAIGVAHAPLEDDRLTALDRRDGGVNQRRVEGGVEAVVLRPRHAASGCIGHRRDHHREIESGTPSAGLAPLPEEVAAPDRLVERGEPEPGQELADLLGHEQEVADDVLGRA